jgi:hypothetical protein
VAAYFFGGVFVGADFVYKWFESLDEASLVSEKIFRLWLESGDGPALKSYDGFVRYAPLFGL